MRKTKIICTLGPATDSEDILRQLLKSGMNVARLNFSHDTHESHLKRAERFRKIRDELKMPAALLMDTMGPKIRLTTFENSKVEIKKGEIFTLTTDNRAEHAMMASVSYENFHKDASKGDRILIDDGLIELIIRQIKGRNIECEVLNGGPLSTRKGVNVPGVSIKLPFISEKDKNDLKFAVDHDFDFVAASFVRSANDVKELRKVLEEYNGTDIKIFAKIENREGFNNIDDIVRVSDGVMVARGDMGVEIPFEELPHIQKEIIYRCYIAGKPVITATQLLDSMIRNPRPTRAEITDIANAIYDGTSALMLSGETSVGKYPVEAVATMAKIAVETEKNIDYISRFQITHETATRNVTNAISHATCTTAHLLGAAAIISITKSGSSAKLVSKYRPACPIIAPTISDKVYQQLSVSWGVYPVHTEPRTSTDDMLNLAVERALETKLVKNGDLVVIAAGLAASISGTTNLMKIHVIGDVLLEGRGHNELSAVGNLCVINEEHHSLEDFTEGDILVIDKTRQEILSVIKNANALVTEEEGEDSHAVIVARALDIPVITDALNATEILKSGTIATVDAKTGRIYSGVKK